MRRTLCVVVVALIAALAPPASAQTVADVSARDTLIAAQENLLNTYRCQFGVDTDAVPGGCGDRQTITPGVAPESPTQADIDVRDRLVQNQEALLNIYRCRFDIDTQLVPGGCSDGEPVAANRGALTEEQQHCLIYALARWGSFRESDDTLQDFLGGYFNVTRETRSCVATGVYDSITVEYLDDNGRWVETDHAWWSLPVAAYAGWTVDHNTIAWETWRDAERSISQVYWQLAAS